MAIEVKHNTQAAGPDAGNGEIRKAQWNEAHALTMATARILGRTTAGAGAVEELSLGQNLEFSGLTLRTTFTTTQVANWDTAFGWGNHASAGYLTSETSHADVLVDGDIGVTVQGYDVDTLKADVGDVLTAGFTSDSYSRGTISSGTVTPAPDTGEEAIQHYTNNGAHTLAPPASPCTVVIEVTNGASAGAITTSGFTMVTGDALTTTSGHDFILYITKTQNFSHLNVVALQ